MRIDKILAIASFIFITLALCIIATTPPATGYEISIYEAYPPYLWFFLTASITCGLFIMVHQTFAERKSRWWVAGFSAILLANFIILLLPMFRGYAFYGRGDELSHLGMIKDIVSSGHIGKENFYPIIHILVVSLSYVAKLEPKLLMMIVSPLFFVFSMLCMYLLATKVTKEHSQMLLVTAFGSLILFRGLTFAPSVQSFLLFPFILFLYYRAVSVASTVALLLVLLLLPFFHFVTTQWLILTFLCLEVGKLARSQINKHRELGLRDVTFELKRTPIIICALLFIISIAWFSAYSGFGSSVNSLSNWLIYQVGHPGVDYYGELLSRANITIYQFLDLFIKMYGQYLLYFAVSAILCVLLARKIFFSKDRIETNQITFAALFIVFSMLVFVFFFNDFVISHGRVMKYTILVSTVLNGVGIYALFCSRGTNNRQNNELRTKRIAPFLVTAILVASMVFGIFNLFPSPIIKSFNQQVTAMELEGMEWFFDRRDETLFVDDIVVGQVRFADALLGREAPKKNLRYDALLPKHFGYDTNEMLGESCKNDKYLINNKLSKVFHTKVYPEWPHLWRFTEEDFNKLDCDPSAGKIYSCIEFEVFYVSSQLD